MLTRAVVSWVSRTLAAGGPPSRVAAQLYNMRAVSLLSLLQLGRPGSLRRLRGGCWGECGTRLGASSGSARTYGGAALRASAPLFVLCQAPWESGSGLRRAGVARRWKPGCGTVFAHRVDI